MVGFFARLIFTIEFVIALAFASLIPNTATTTEHMFLIDLKDGYATQSSVN